MNLLILLGLAGVLTVSIMSQQRLIKAIDELLEEGRMRVLPIPYSD